MPSLFNRRSRSVSTTRPAPVASSSAHLAAAQAFMAKQPNAGNLSSAAAAAALRSMSPTPTPINQVQTKRMRERQSSVSSVGSGTRGRPRNGLQRQPSAGSMTERTFRSPSPGQNTSEPVPRGNAPPVPRVPQQFVTEDLPPVPKKAHRRSMSLDTSSPRVLSPPPARSTGQSQTANRAPPQPPPVLSAAATAARRSASLQQNNELERSDSRNSINFSYPRGSRPSSPPPRSPVAANGVSEQGSSTAGISATEAANIQNALNKTTAKPVKKKKKKVAQNQGEGSYLQTGSVASAPTASSASTGADVARQATEDQATPKSKKRAALTGQSSHFPEAGPGEDASVATSTATSSPASEKRTSRASGLLQKQPSVVREDWEGERDEESSSPTSPVSSTANSRSIPGPSGTVQSKKPATAANVSRKIEDSSKSGLLHNSVTTPVSKPVETVKALSPETHGTRQASISPSRSFRFSDRLASDLTAGRKHEPLPRSVSPAKSALKHHSPARAEASPGSIGAAARRGSSVTPSESSEVSADGWSQRKKAVRVSFEADPEVVGVSADVDPALRTAEKEGSKRGLFGFGKTKGSALGTVPPELEADEGMKPRPALPSFGSVRKNRQAENSPSPTTKRQDNSNVSSPRSPTLSEASSAAEPSTMQTSVSSDHVVGGVLFREAQKQNHPLPPEVTSVEGTGYHSDTDSLSSDGSEDDELRAAAGAALHYSETGNSPHEEVIDRSVPAIAVQPATPGPDEGLRSEEWITDASRDRETGPSSPDTGDEKDDYDTHPTPATQTLNTIMEEESSDNDSIYSDAAEDLSDLEGDGFGSINAIVESPMVRSPAAKSKDVPDSPTVAPAAGRAESKESGAWDTAQAHWSTLAQQSRQNLDQKKETEETPTAGSHEAEPKVPVQRQPDLQKEEKQETAKTEPTKVAAAPLEPPARISSKPKGKRKKKQQQQQQPPPPAALAATTAATSMVRTPPAQVKRAQPSSPGTDGSSPSTGAVVATKRLSAATKQGGFRHSMRSDPAPAPTLRQRPQSMVAAPPEPRGALQKKHIPPQSPPKPVQRTFSNDSDSDSSFRKERRNRRAAKSGGFGMRQSMRSGPASANNQPAARDTRRDVRSMSPVNRRPTSPLGGAMRMTMRGSQDRAAPTLRSQPEQKRSSSLFGRGRKTNAPARPTSSFGSKLKSRIVDSDDEDGPRQTTYKSRFADSSDEEDFEPLRPVRGIPKRKDEGDSTDLDDSSDDQRRKAKTTPKKKLEIQVPTVSSPIPSEPMSPTTAKKKGFWGRLRGKKDKDKDLVPEASVGPQSNGVKADLVNGQDDKKNAGDLGFNSTAERDALVEETMRKLEAAQGEPSSPARGKLQRRITPQRVLSDSWPLPPKMPAAGEQRPITSDGVGAATRPGMGERLPTTDTLRTAGGTEVYGRNGKKKRFPRLRKAFGLTD